MPPPNPVKAVCNQPVTIERRTGRDTYGEDIYAPPETILARLEPDDGLVRTVTGEEVQADSKMLSVVKVSLGDLISGTITLASAGGTISIQSATIKRVTPIVAFDGTVLGFRSRL